MSEDNLRIAIVNEDKVGAVMHLLTRRRARKLLTTNNDAIQLSCSASLRNADKNVSRAALWCAWVRNA